MSTVLQTLISRLFKGSQEKRRVVILGLDNSGKTTLLYRLALNQTVQTVPSIGFNIETVVAPADKYGGKPFLIEAWDTGAGCGGMHNMLRLISAYARDADAMIWVVDGNDRQRLEESREVFQSLWKWIPDERRAIVPVMIFANKQDLRGAIPVDDIRRAFMSVTSGMLWNVFRTCVIEDLAIGGLPEAFDWLQFVFANRAHPPASASVSINSGNSNVEKKETPVPAEDSAAKLAAWVSRALDDSAPDEFLRQFRTLSLPAWDHYTHIRIAYTILTLYGRQQGKELIFEGIKSYIAESSQTRGRTFHETMTYFWIQMVHFGIRSMPDSVSLISSEGDDELSITNVHDPVGDADLGDAGSTATLTNGTNFSTTEAGILKRNSTPSASLMDFARFMLVNPHVVNGNLWVEYYSKDVMMTPIAKNQMVLPDKRSLPNLVIRDAIGDALKNRGS